MGSRVMVGTDFSAYRHMAGVIIAVGQMQRLVRLDGLPNHPLMFDLRELVWL